MSKGLARFTMGMTIEGMKIPGFPEGSGDRKIGFEAYIPADNAEMADEIYYGHLSALCGEDEAKAIAAKLRAQK